MPNTDPAGPAMTNPDPPTLFPWTTRLREEVRARLDLRMDQADPAVIDEALRGGVVFRGTNLWLLLFAILIASVGLNVNSTAVIIGAMLISPLMGPILGVGYGAAVADFRLVRLSFWNLAIATLVSILASAVYFSITPLAEAHSELLARTSPTLWDVLIALFGGLAGIVGLTRRERSNVVPGVAIATALMPPLCTAGHGLATGNVAHFVGAFYLFVINSVFIAASTFLMIRMMHLPELQHVDAAASRRAHRWILALVLGTAAPSLLLAQRLVVEEVFSARANRFLAEAFPADGPTIMVGHNADAARHEIRVTVLGEPVTPERKAALVAMLPAYGLPDTTLAVAQNEAATVDVEGLREGLLRDLYQGTLAELAAKEAAITRLTAQVAEAQALDKDDRAVEREILAQHPTLSRVVVTTVRAPDRSGVVAVLEGTVSVGPDALQRLRAWLPVRLDAADAWVVEVKPPPPAPE